MHVMHERANARTGAIESDKPDPLCWDVRRVRTCALTELRTHAPERRPAATLGRTGLGEQRRGALVHCGRGADR